MKKLLIILFIIININTLIVNGSKEDARLEIIKSRLEEIDGKRKALGDPRTVGSSAANLYINLDENTVSIACDNGARNSPLSLNPDSMEKIIEFVNKSGFDLIDETPTPPVTPPTPPAPIVTNESRGTCDSEIYRYEPKWSTCDATGYTWTSDGKIKCKQENTWEGIPRACGEKIYEITETCDINGECEQKEKYLRCDTNSCTNVSRPAKQTQEKVLSILLDNPITDFKNAYANNLDENHIVIKSSVNTNQGKDIVNIPNTFDVQDLSGLNSDRIEQNGGNALNFSNVEVKVPNRVKSGEQEFIKITGIKSRAPLNVNDSKIGLIAGGVKLKEITNVKYNFKKPFTGYLETKDIQKGTWDGLTTLGTQNEYRLGLKSVSSLSKNSLNNYSVNDFSGFIEPNGEGLSVQNSSLNKDTLKDVLGTIFYSTINTSKNADKLNNNPGIQVNLPIIEYKLGGEQVRYYLSQKDEGDDKTPIKTTGGEFLGVKVIGGIQGAGKSEFTGQEANISNLYNSEQRTQIRKNAYSFVKNMKSGNIVDGVKYVKGDYKLSSGENFETLVIVDGNLILDKDFNASNTTLKGIIVLQDGYDVEKDFSGKGNIYITPNVTKINAIIYADGGIISADQAGKPYLVDSIERTSKLNKQLILNGSVFTRNTIGGGILAGNNYVLPGGKKLTPSDDNFNKAKMYDLNYVRRGNVGNNGTYVEPFIIKYDSRMQISPPRLFVK